MSTQLNPEQLETILDQALPGLSSASSSAPGQWITPPPLQPSHRKRLERAQELISELMESRLRLLFKLPTEVSPRQIEVLFSEELRREDQKKVTYLISLMPMEREVPLSLERDLFFLMADRLLGGPGSIQAEREEISELEYSLGHRIVSAILPSFQQGLQKALPLEATVTRHLDENEDEGSFSSWEAILKFSFQVTQGEEKGEVWLTLPYNIVLNQLMEGSKEQAGGEEIHPALAGHVETTPLTLSLVLGKASLSFQELLKLETGDIIRLGSSPGQNFSLSLGKQTMLKGKIGAVSGRYAFRIQEVKHGQSYSE